MLAITRLDIRPQVAGEVSLVIADGQFNLHQEFKWECIGKHTLAPARFIKTHHESAKVSPEFEV